MSKFIRNPNTTTADGVVRNLEEMAAQMQKAATGALFIEATEIMNDAIKITPMDTGNLRDSHYVEPPKKTATGGMSIKIGFGGTAAPYALAVHERTDKGINWQEAGTGPKFLERALDARTPSLANNIKSRMQRIIASNYVPPTKT